MKVKREAIPPEGKEISLDELPPLILRGIEGEEERQLELESGIEGRLSFSRTPKGIEVVGHFRTSVELQCARCLKTFSLPIVAEFDEFFIGMHYAPREEDTELSNDDMNISFLPEEGIDISDIVEEQMWLNIPMKPLCHDGCKGLCRVCGADLNVGECGCDRRYNDPRFSVLKDVRSNLLSRRR